MASSYPIVTIYSHDGTEVIFSRQATLNAYSLSVSENALLMAGFTSTSELYTYSGNKIFKGFATEANGELVYTIGDTVTKDETGVILYLVVESPPTKLIFGGNTIIDLSQVNVTPEALATGYTAHDATGKQITGTGTVYGDTNTGSSGSGGASRVVCFGDEKINFTADTVCEGVLLEGYKAFSAAGILLNGVGSADKPLDMYTWAEIAALGDSGEAKNVFSVGDVKMIHVEGTVGTLSVNQDLGVYIIGFDHNSSKEGTGIHFGTFKTAVKNGTDVCLVDSKCGSGSKGGTKVFNITHGGRSGFGGWKGCDLRYDILGSTDMEPMGYLTDDAVGLDATPWTTTEPSPNTLMAALPSDLRAVMRPITKYTDNINNTSDTASNVTSSIDYLPLLSEFEVWGVRTYANSAEQNYQQQYAYYINGNSKIKYKHSNNATAVGWWTRSPGYRYTREFCINVNSGIDTKDGTDSQGLAPIFKVGGGAPVTTQSYNITTSNISTYFTVSNSSYYFAGSGSTFTTNNAGVASSTAQTTLTAKANMYVSFNYSYSSEASYDKFTLTVAGTTVENAVSGATTNKSYTGSLTVGQQIVFKYTKDGSVNKNDDKCTFSNMVVTQ